jgi:hypothetical protein
MLPGFRFLFAAIILSMSVLIFGLGAAALLRAAHEEFASNPSWHAAPEATFAQQGENAKADTARAEAIRPVLAILRVEPPAIEQPSGEVPTAAAPAEPAVIPPTPAEPEKVAALKPEDASPPEPAKPEIPVVESPKQEKPEIPVSASPASGSPVSGSLASEVAAPDAATSVDEKKTAAGETLSPAKPVQPAEAPPAASVPTSAAASPEADRASTRIATLGGPPVSIEAPPRAKAAVAKPDRGDAIKKQQQRAREAAQRRRIAARARQARQALQLQQQQAASPFAQPAPAAGTR